MSSRSDGACLRTSHLPSIQGKPRHVVAFPIEIDLAATLLFGLIGFLAAMRRGYDWIGVFALAFATAVGGDWFAIGYGRGR